MGLLVLHYETGSQWAWYTVRLVHSGPGTPEIGSHCVMRLVHEIGSHCVTRLVHSGPGTIRDWFTMGLLVFNCYTVRLVR